MKPTIEWLAKEINNDCENYRYFWAYGLVQESLKLWTGDRLNLLCAVAQHMVWQCNQ